MANTEKISDLYGKILGEVSKVIVGKDEIKEALMLALVAGGHLLIEGLPGTAKTKLAKSFARAISGQFKRIQFTSDMMPADITGFYIYSPDGDSRLIKGPIFANVVLADELNRTTPRTQSALLEAMQEFKVTVDGILRQLPVPFFVIATQNPVEFHGTYPLPESQVDRFVMQLGVGYPSNHEEVNILTRNLKQSPLEDLKSVVDMQDIVELQNVVTSVHVEPNIADYIVRIISTTRNLPGDIKLGASPRASLALMRTARVLAFLDKRDYVIPDDVKRLAYSVLKHRLILQPRSVVRGLTARDIVSHILKKVAAPV